MELTSFTIENVEVFAIFTMFVNIDITYIPPGTDGL